jgi:predicted DNA-binding WGR domain protein
MASIPTTRARRFEFVGGTSSKFWEIAVQGAEVTVRFGRIGTQGQTQEKSFPSADDANKHADKLIAEKTRKGYSEIA